MRTVTPFMSFTDFTERSLHPILRRHVFPSVYLQRVLMILAYYVTLD